MSCSNLPKWPGAEAVYRRAYRMLEKMGASGHVTRRKTHRPKGASSGYTCFPSEEMNDLIEALQKGNEERIKGLLMIYANRGFER